MKRAIAIMDKQFAHGTSLGSGDLKIYPKYFDWYRHEPYMETEVCVITESCFHQADMSKAAIKIAMIIEPISIDPRPYQWIRENHSKFRYVLTHNKELREELGEKAVWYPFGGCWIEPEDRKIWPKTKDVSIIVSDKRQTEGHILRHEIVNNFGSLVGVYGRGYNPVGSKLEALRDYRFSIVVENEKNNGWFTEKIIDCFMTGTIPIYWGCKSIDVFFTGVPTFNDMYNAQYPTIPSLQQLLSSSNKNTYEYGMPFVERNFELAKKYTCPEDWLWLNFFNSIYFTPTTFK